MNRHSPELPVADATQATQMPMLLAREAPFHIGELLVEPELRRITRADGVATQLEPLMTKVLVTLARARGHVVSRDDLIESCWGGRIVGDDSIARVIFHLRKVAADFAEGAFSIETTAKVGFRLVGELAKESPDIAQSPSPRRWWISRRWTITVVAALILAALGLFAYDATRARPPIGIAVLPFTDVDGNRAELAVGLSEELLAGLAREPGLRVAGRSSAAMFGDGRSSPKEIGRRLGVDYLIEGSVLGEGDELRVNLAVIDADNGLRIWSQRFADDRGDLFALQDRIAAAVVAHVGPRLSPPSKAKGALRTDGPTYELYLVAKSMIRSRVPDKVQAARDILQRVVRLDPNFAPAWAELGPATAIAAAQVQNDPNPPDMAEVNRRALGYVDRALRLAPNLASAHAARGRVLEFKGEALPSLQRAVRLDPKDAQAWFWLGAAYEKADRPDQTAEALQQCARLEPFWVMCSPAADYLAKLGRFDEARALDVRIARLSPDPAQRSEAQARLRLRAGDWSGFVAGIRQATTQSASLRGFKSVPQRAMLFRLGIESELQDTRSDRERIASDLLLGRIGSEEIIRRAIENQRAFLSGQAVNALEVHLLAQSRYAELAALAPLLFGTEAQPGPAAEMIPVMGPGVAFALRREGRGAEAEAILDKAEVWIRKVRGQRRTSALNHFWAARYHTVRGQWREATDSLLRARAQGWPNNCCDEPWVIAWPDRDPLLRPLLSDPRIKRIADEVAEQRDRERRETLAVLGRGPNKSGAADE